MTDPDESRPPHRRSCQKSQPQQQRLAGASGGKKRPAEPRARIPTLSSCLPPAPSPSSSSSAPPATSVGRGGGRRDMMSAMYGESAFQKRRKMTSPIGRWFAVMFARNREVDGEVGRAERTRIRYTSHIGSIFFATAAAAFASSSSCSAGEENGEEEEEDAPRRMYLVANEEPSGGKEAPEDERAAAKKKTRGQWHVVLALGPMREESDANGVCRLWSLSQKGVISKAARGEAISIRFDIPGFVDWSTVFGSAEKLCRMYDILFYKNPCGGEPPCAEEIAKRKGNDGDRRSAEAEKT